MSQVNLSSSGRQSFAEYFSALTITTLLLVILLLNRRRKMSKKTRMEWIPGPRQYLLGNYLNLLQAIIDRKETVNVMTNWCRNHHRSSPIMRVAAGPVEIVFLLSPHYIQKLFGSMAAEHLGRPPVLFDRLKPVEWFDGIMSSQGKKWKERRKLLNPHFNSHASLLRNVPELNDCGRKLVGGLEALFDDKAEPRPIISLLNEATLASILKTTFGIDVDDEAASRDFATATKELYEIVSTRLTTPWLTYDTLWRLSPLSKKLRDIYHKTRQVLEERIKVLTTSTSDGSPPEEQHRKSLLSELIAAGLSTEAIYEETMTMIAAGQETTECTLHYLLFFLALHPELQERAQEEVDSVFDSEADQLFFVDGDISGSGLKKLQYLEQCILESLRIVPTAPGIGRQLQGPLKLDDEGLELPAGTTVGVWLPGLHMNPEIYPNPERFDPDRWAPEERARRHPYSYLAFAAGPRKCIGYKFAMNEMLILAAHVLRNFTFRTSERFENVVWLLHITLTPETPLKFVFEKRNV